MRERRAAGDPYWSYSGESSCNLALLVVVLTRFWPTDDVTKLLVMLLLSPNGPLRFFLPDPSGKHGCDQTCACVGSDKIHVFLK